MKYLPKSCRLHEALDRTSGEWAGLAGCTSYDHDHVWCMLYACGATMLTAVYCPEPCNPNSIHMQDQCFYHDFTQNLHTHYFMFNADSPILSLRGGGAGGSLSLPEGISSETMEKMTSIKRASRLVVSII